MRTSLVSRSAASRGPGSRTAVRKRLGLAGGLVIFIFTAIALSAAVGNIRVGSYSFSAFAAVLAGGASWTLVLLYRRMPRSAARAAAPFAAFLLAMLASAVLGRINREGVQFLMVQVAFLGALLVGAIARREAGVHLEDLIARCIRFTTVVFCGAVILERVGVGQAVGGDRSSAIASLIAMSWFLAEYKSGRRKSLWWALAILLAAAITLSRTALLAGFVLLVLSTLFNSRKHWVRGIVVCTLLLSTGYWAVTSWSPLHDRFVQGDTSLSVGGININAEGRTQVWQTLWSEVPDQLVVGHGPGSASARTTAIAPDLSHPHNDYLRILYDFGALGLALFAWFVFRCAQLLRRARIGPAHSLAALAAANAGLAILVMMTTDNPLDYAYAMIPLAALIGIGVASAYARRPKSSPTWSSPPVGRYG